MIKINLGCGNRDFGSDWYHVDGGNYPHLDSNNIIDLPYEKNSVDLIYASHVIGYFDREEIKSVILGWKKKLKDGGILRLAVPDFYAISKLYLEKPLTYGIEDFLGPLYGKMKMGKEIIYHKTAYDHESLYDLLGTLEFKDIKEWDWRYKEHGIYDDCSQAYLPKMDKDNGTLISLNMEAKK